MDFGLTDEQRSIVEVTRAFVERELYPYEEEVERTGVLRPDVADGLRLLEEAGVPFDLVTNRLRHLEHVDYLSERFPDLPVVIDHLGKPPVGTEEREPWASLEP